MSDNSVTVAEAISIRVGNYITNSHALALADSIGNALSSLTHIDSLGLLKGVRPLRKKFAGIFSYRVRRPFVAVLWFNNQARGATHKKWHLDVYGRTHMPLIQELAIELSTEFQVAIHIRLVSEVEHEEYFYGDGSM